MATVTVAFVGPLPPPIHGFSMICSAMLAQLREFGRVEVFDRAERSGNPALRFFSQLIRPLRYLGAALRGNEFALYVGLSGGTGQVVDLLYIVIGRIFRHRLIVHHHSFAYIDSPSVLSRLVLSFARHATHIVLSPGMGAALVKAYRLDAGNVRVVSNAAFHTSFEHHPRESDRSATSIRIGFLSNITFDKGFVEFFGVLQRLRALGVEFQAYIAGPITADARGTFELLLAASEDVAYAGPLYGDARDQFYQRLDILLFPTRYANEAEPLVILEAMQSGVIVIACNRGSIAEMLRNDAGVVYECETFVDAAATWILDISADRDRLQRVQRMALEQAQRNRNTADMELNKVLREISGNSADPGC